eukprot:7469025-Alexandrium_andersonii.AAC.1
MTTFESRTSLRPELKISGLQSDWEKALRALSANSSLHLIGIPAGTGIPGSKQASPASGSEVQSQSQQTT